MPKDFWPDQTIAVLGAGNFGTVLANLAAQNTGSVRFWTRREEESRQINATRAHPRFHAGLTLDPKIRAYSELERVFETPPAAVIWALPSAVCREAAKQFAPYLTGSEIILHATKGIEEGTLKRMTEVLREELPCPRIGVISGPNLATEIAKGEPAATVVASRFDEVCNAGVELLSSDRMRVYTSHDVIGVEWAGTLKNILAIASGALDALGYGWNARAMLITRGLAEMVRFGVAMGAEPMTFLGLAGAGDLMATCGSPLSRNYRVGAGLAKGVPLEQILAELGSTAEGVKTTRIVFAYAKRRGIQMPITEAVHSILEEGSSVADALQELMRRPSLADTGV